MRCPFCGGSDITGSSHEEARRELRVAHTDGSSCAKAPVDRKGEYRGWGK